MRFPVKYSIAAQYNGRFQAMRAPTFAGAVSAYGNNTQTWRQKLLGLDESDGALLSALSEHAAWIVQAEPRQITKIVADAASNRAFAVHTTKEYNGNAVVYNFSAESGEDRGKWMLAFAQCGHPVIGGRGGAWEDPQRRLFNTSPPPAAAPAAVSQPTRQLPPPPPRALSPPPQFNIATALADPINAKLEALLVEEMMLAQQQQEGLRPLPLSPSYYDAGRIAALPLSPPSPPLPPPPPLLLSGDSSQAARQQDHAAQSTEHAELAQRTLLWQTQFEAELAAKKRALDDARATAAQQATTQRTALEAQRSQFEAQLAAKERSAMAQSNGSAARAAELRSELNAQRSQFEAALGATRRRNQDAATRAATLADRLHEELDTQRSQFQAELIAKEQALSEANAAALRAARLRALQRATSVIGGAATLRRAKEDAAAELQHQRATSMLKRATASLVGAARLKQTKASAAAELEQVQSDAAAAQVREKSKHMLQRATSTLAGAAKLKKVTEAGDAKLKRQKTIGMLQRATMTIGERTRMQRLRDEHAEELSAVEAQLRAKEAELAEKVHLIDEANDRVAKLGRVNLVQKTAFRIGSAAALSKAQKEGEEKLKTQHELAAAELDRVAEDAKKRVASVKRASRMQRAVSQIGNATRIHHAERESKLALALQKKKAAAASATEKESHEHALSKQRRKNMLRRANMSLAQKSALREAAETNEKLQASVGELRNAAIEAERLHREAQAEAVHHQKEADAAALEERVLATSVANAKKTAANSAQRWRAAITSKKALDKAVQDAELQRVQAVESGAHADVKAAHVDKLELHKVEADEAAAHEENAIAQLVLAKKAVTSASERWRAALATKKAKVETAKTAEEKRVLLQVHVDTKKEDVETTAKEAAASAISLEKLEIVSADEPPLGAPPPRLVVRAALPLSSSFSYMSQSTPQRLRNHFAERAPAPICAGSRVVLWREDAWVEAVVSRVLSEETCEVEFDSGYTAVEEIATLTRVSGVAEQHIVATLCLHIREWCAAGEVKKANGMLNSMRRTLRLAPDIHAYNAVVNEWCTQGNVVTAETIVEDMVRVGMKPDAVTYNCLILAWCKTDMMHAESVYSEMFDRGIAPTGVTLNAMVQGWAAQGSLERAQPFINVMTSTGTVLTAKSYNALIRAQCVGGRIEDAVNTINVMSSVNVYPNAGTLDALIVGCVDARNTAQAAAAVEDMHPWGIEPSPVNFRTIVKGFCQERMMQEAEHVLEQMQSVDIQPDAVVYTALMKGWYELQERDFALDVLQRMRAAAVEPTVATLNQLVLIHSNEGNMAGAVECVDNLCCGVLQPNFTTYKLLLRGYCATGDMEGASGVIAAIKLVDASATAMQSSMSRRGATPQIIKEMLKSQAFLSMWFKSKDPSATLTLFLSNGIIPDSYTFHGLVLSLVVRYVRGRSCCKTYPRITTHPTSSPPSTPPFRVPTEEALKMRCPASLICSASTCALTQRHGLRCWPRSRRSELSRSQNGTALVCGSFRWAEQNQTRRTGRRRERSPTSSTTSK